MLWKNVCRIKISSNLSTATCHFLHIEITWVAGKSFRRLACIGKERGAGNAGIYCGEE